MVDGADAGVPLEVEVPLAPDVPLEVAVPLAVAVPLEADLIVGGACAAGAAGGVTGVNDGARSRGVKSDELLAASSVADDVTGVEDEGEAAAPLVDLAIPSAGIGAACPGESTAFSAVVTVSSLDVPLAPLTGVFSVRVAPAPADPERELPVLVRDDDMELLSTTASSSATS